MDWPLFLAVRKVIGVAMSTSAISSATTTTIAETTTSSSSSSFSSEDFLSLLVTQLQNQNPLEPTSTDKILDQMLSYASYSQDTEATEALSNISAKLDTISDAIVDISV